MECRSTRFTCGSGQEVQRLQAELSSARRELDDMAVLLEIESRQVHCGLSRIPELSNSEPSRAPHSWFFRDGSFF